MAERALEYNKMRIYIFTPSYTFESVHIGDNNLENIKRYLSEWNGGRLVFPNFLGDGGILYIPPDVAKLSVVKLSAT